MRPVPATDPKNKTNGTEQGQEKIKGEQHLLSRFDAVLSRKRFFDALQATEYETTREQYDELRALNLWRKQAQLSPAREFYHLTENFSLLETENFTAEEKKTLRGHLADRMTGNAAKLGPNAGQLYLALLAELDGSTYEPELKLARKKFAQMRADRDVEYLVSPSVTTESKLGYLETQLAKVIAGMNQLDQFEDKREEEEMSEEERAERQEKLDQEDASAPEDSEESKPSMDEMSRLKEGERAQPIWLIKPAHGGYFREKSFDTWDPTAKKWTRAGGRYENFSPDNQGQGGASEKKFTMTAVMRPGRWQKIACPYTYEFAGVEGGNSGFRFRHDGSGGISILKEGDGGPVSVALAFVEKADGRRFADVPRKEASADTENFSEESSQAIEEIKKTKTGNMARAFALARYTRERLTYSNESSFNSVYESDPNGYCFAIDTHRQADCDVANTYFAGLCRKLGVPVRHVVGHMVKGKYEGDTSAITSGTGHAWSEVWDEREKEWQRIDATPSGDPNMEEEREPSENEESVPGDYGEQEALTPTDEELEKLAEKLAIHVEKLSYTPAERKIAEETGIELKEAREIVREINKAEDTRLPDGRRITDALAQLFDMIVDSRKHFIQEYAGPVRRREGGEQIDDIVRHYIGTQAGESDPLSRVKEKDFQKEEKLFGGFDVRLIGDKSGSMSETVNGERKWEMQRRVSYLILSALHRFEEKLERAGVQAIAGSSLDVRTENISFRGESQEDLDIDKPLSAHFESSDKVKLWHSLTKRGGNNGDVVALQTIHYEISEEIRALEKQGKKDNRLRIVIATTDGQPDSVRGVHQMAEALGRLGTVVIGVGLTETAKGVKQIYTTPWSRGEYVESIEDLPLLVAKYVILEALKLFPEKAQEQNKQALAMMLREFQK